MSDLRHGIDIWQGAPGSGKSYGAVDLMVRAVLRQRRPVYTNLPLKMRVLRQYLLIKSGDEKLTRYVHSIDRNHFYRFMKRNESFAEYKEKLQAQGIGHGEIERRFQMEQGEHVYEGPDAQWFYPGSVFILDEFHRWADQRLQKDEDPAFLTYATMHRHHIHWIILLTQDRMQVSIPWRRNMATLIHCSDKRRLPFLFGLKLPLAAFAYEEYPGEMVKDGQKLAQVQPINTDVLIPALNKGTIFRCYDSYTHMGGRRRLENKLNQVREQVEGEPVKKQDNVGGTPTKKRGRWKRWSLAAAACVACAVVSPVITGGCSETEKPQVKQTRPVTSGERFAVQTKQKKEKEQEYKAPLVTVVGAGYVVADGKVTRVGQTIGQFTLLGISDYDGETLWNIRDLDVPVPLGLPVIVTGADLQQATAAKWAADQAAGDRRRDESGSTAEAGAGRDQAGSAEAEAGESHSRGTDGASGSMPGI
ncbi:zonular occludens toxin domain-containing protein [Mucisphaera calidilacus]|uniref:zonular occludens toxin domain-containing protein n=1 Tax=Mucisphaera calidilacus TaxID=2527982 RepID=UPI001F3504C6|nr:zonular occludens toxin domain-containing protein [Mucisphaera calidilacus]